MVFTMTLRRCKKSDNFRIAKVKALFYEDNKRKHATPQNFERKRMQQDDTRDNCQYENEE
jgi:hypothetical protein